MGIHAKFKSYNYIRLFYITCYVNLPHKTYRKILHVRMIYTKDVVIATALSMSEYGVTEETGQKEKRIIERASL